MNHKAAAVQHYTFTFQDRLFLDANIWLYVSGSLELSTYWRSIYTNAFNRILQAKSRIYIDALVVSEFINSYARVRWKLIAPHINQFKDFRNSQGFEPVAKNIVDDVKQIMKHCSRIESGFATLSIDNLLSNYATGDYDFNDQVITEICKSNGFTLITNDGDFKTQRIPILTANQSLLRN